MLALDYGGIESFEKHFLLPIQTKNTTAFLRNRKDVFYNKIYMRAQGKARGKIMHLVYDMESCKIRTVSLKVKSLEPRGANIILSRMEDKHNTRAKTGEVV